MLRYAARRYVMVSKRRLNVISLYLNDEELRIIQKLAEYDGRSMTQEVRVLLMQRIKDMMEGNSDGE